MFTLSEEKKRMYKATSDDLVPTSGFMYTEIAKQTLKSTEACQTTQDYLMNRLAHDSPNVKYKALRVMKHCVEKGNPLFRKDLQRRLDLVRQAAQFHGPPDPLRGDQPYRIVREEAAQLMELVFHEPVQAPLAAPQPSAGFSATATGIGNTAFASGHGGGGGGSGSGGATPTFSSGNGRYGGYGNPNFQHDRRSSDSSGPDVAGFLASVQNKVSAVFGDLDAGSKPRSVHFANAGPSPGSGSNGFGSSYAARGAYQGASISSATTAAQSGGIGGASPSTAASPATSSYYQAAQQGTWSASIARAADSPSGQAAWGASVTGPSKVQASEAGDHETRLVDEITHPGGMRPAPPREDIAQFIARVASLDMTLVVNGLISKLSAPKWQTRYKALCVVEAMLRSPSTADASRQALEPCIESIRAAQTSTQASVRDKAAKLVKVLAGAGDASPSPLVSPAPAAARGGETPQAAASPAPATTASSRDSSAPVSLFAGLNLAGASQAASAAPQTAATASASAPAPQTANLLDLGADEPAPAAPSTAAPGSSSDVNFDPLASDAAAASPGAGNGVHGSGTGIMELALGAGGGGAPGGYTFPVPHHFGMPMNPNVAHPAFTQHHPGAPPPAGAAVPQVGHSGVVPVSLPVQDSFDFVQTELRAGKARK